MSQGQTHDTKDIEENKILAAIGYIGILCLLPLLLKPKSQFAKFNGKQGLVLCIGWVINSVIAILIGWIPIIGWLIVLAGTGALLILTVLGILKSLAGEYWEMPYLSEYAKKINI